MAATLRPQAGSLVSTATTMRKSLLKPAKSSFSTATRSSAHLRIHSQSLRPSLSTRIVSPSYIAPSTTTVRQASSASAPNSTSNPEDALTWDRFFEIRRRRRYVNLLSSLATAAGTVFVLGPVIAQQDIDGWAAQVSGIDPIIVLGATTFAAAAGGWLCGPTFGNGLFRLWAGRKGWQQPIAEKERSFFARIKRYRADPSSSSPQNPIPDYYGEKIASVKDYRRWLKDQRAFNLKKNKNML